MCATRKGLLLAFVVVVVVAVVGRAMQLEKGRIVGIFVEEMMAPVESAHSALGGMYEQVEYF